jgi:hypothetical protein
VQFQEKPDNPSKQKVGPKFTKTAKNSNGIPGFAANSTKNLVFSADERITEKVRNHQKMCNHAETKAPKWGKVHAARTKGVALY